MHRVVVYTAPMCAYCRQAKALLTSRGIPFEEIDLGFDTEQRKWLRERTGRSTVPQIFIDDKSIGGFDELAQLDRKGSLVELEGG